MKILHVGPIRATKTATGPNHSIRGLAHAQAQIGAKTAILTSVPLANGVEMEASPGVVMLGGPEAAHRNPWSISKAWIDMIETKFGRPDIVNFHSTYDTFQVALARKCRQAGWKYVVTPRGGMTLLAQHTKRLKKTLGNILFFKSFVAGADAIHALCDSEAEQIQKSFKVKRIFVVPNGAEDDLLNAAERLKPADMGYFKRGNELLLGFVGRIDMNHKGLDLLLKAMGQLKRNSGTSFCRLLVVGPFRTAKDEKLFRHLMQYHKLHDDIELLGPKFGDEKLSYYLACDVFVHTSRFEGMPMAVIEAMAVGKPCLATPGTNMSDVVCRGGGWECAPSPESIAEKLEQIYQKRDSLIERGKQSKKLMQTEFTWKIVAEKTIHEYQNLIN